MKIATFEYKDMSSVGIVDIENKKIIPMKEFGLVSNSMISLINEIEEKNINISNLKVSDKKSLDLYDVKILSPIPNPEHDVICLGLNYYKHVLEAESNDNDVYSGSKTHAVYFGKRVDRAVDPFGEIDGHFDINEKLDYEVELAVVIGKTAKNVKSDDALDYIFGYTILNDMSARDLQANHKQWYFGKGLDQFTPIGPWIVTADEIGINPMLKIKSYVNDELRQDSNTSEMIYKINNVIEELTKGMTLQPGTIISTGTPAGVGLGDEAKYLRSGDKIKCVIEKIGELENIVI